MNGFISRSAILLAYSVATLAIPTAGDIVSLSGPPGFSISSLTAVGSGCPPGSTLHAVNADNTAVTVIFSDYVATVGPTIPATENFKDCALSFDVTVPAGYSFGIASVSYRAFYQLDEKVTSSQHSSYSFEATKQVSARTEVTGPISGDVPGSYAFGSVASSACGGSGVLTILNDISANNSENLAGSGIAITDALDFNLVWKKC